MSIKLQIINQAIRRIEKRLEKITFILEARPLSEIILLRQRTIETVKNMAASSESLLLLSDAIKEEKALFRLAKQQEKMAHLISEKVRLDCELSELNFEKMKMEKNIVHNGF